VILDDFFDFLRKLLARANFDTLFLTGHQLSDRDLQGGNTPMTLHLPLSNRLAKHSKSTLSRVLKIFIDMGVITLAYFLAYAIRFEGNIPSAELTSYFNSNIEVDSQ